MPGCDRRRHSYKDICFGARFPPVTIVHKLGLQENIPLSELTTMRVGGPARYFFVARNIDDVQHAVLFARTHNVPFHILGDGSNVIVSDEGFNGLVIKPDIKGVRFEESVPRPAAGIPAESLGIGAVTVIAGAGENWDAFVEQTVKKNLFGIENLSAIPGTVGAAPVQNIGAYGVEVKDTVAWVKVFNTNTLRTTKISHEECEFIYRGSIFKRPENKHLIITHVAFTLFYKGNTNTDYKDITEYIKKHNLQANALLPKDLRRIITIIRSQKLPSINKVGTAGSFFKNPILSKEKFSALSHIYPGLPGYDVGESNVKVPLAWIIDKVCGMKGDRRGDIALHSKQALILVNHGKSTAQDVKKFAEEIKDDVKRKTGIDVEFEVSFVGKF